MSDAVGTFVEKCAVVGGFAQVSDSGKDDAVSWVSISSKDLKSGSQANKAKLERKGLVKKSKSPIPDQRTFFPHFLRIKTAPLRIKINTTVSGIAKKLRNWER
jgi:hypothetical protein